MSGFDVYKEWLQIDEPARPLNHYQLLKLKMFEDNSVLIRKQYRSLNAHVRKFAAGQFAEASQNLLNELAKAMLCLTDASRKAEYDASLGREGVQVKRRRSLEDILLLNKIVPEDRMRQVKSYADTVGIDLQLAVLQQKLAQPEIVMLAYAESIGLPFISLEDIGVDETIAPQINPNTARQHSFVPVMTDHGQLILASPTPVNPDVEEELRVLFEMPVRCAICTPAQINEAISKYYPKDAVQMVIKSGTKATAKPATIVQEKNASTKAEKPVPEKKKKEKPAKKELEIKEPLSEEEAKLRQQSTILAFCFSMMIIGGGSFALGYGTSMAQIVGILGSGLVVGGIAAGVAWKVLSK